MEHIKGNFLSQLWNGNKFYEANNLTDYLQNFREVEYGRNGIITEVLGEYNVIFSGKRLDFNLHASSMYMFRENPQNYPHNFIIFNHDIKDSWAKLESVGFDLKLFLNRDINLDLFLQHSFFIKNPRINYNLNYKRNIILDFEKVIEKKGPQLVINNLAVLK